MRILRYLAVGALLASAALTASAAAPRYVFYFIGDGMGMGQVMATEAYNRTVLGNTDPLLMMQFPTVSMATTYSASSPITDSAAAGTALATGHKTRNSMLGVTPDTTAVQSIAATLFKKGWGVGIVTSVCPDDATPGAFYAHQPKRSSYYEIGCEAAACGYEFIGGSNLRGLKDKKGNPTDLLARFAENDVTIVRGTDRLADVATRRVLLLNTDSVLTSNIGYTIDSVPGVLTLPEMTRACLAHLEKLTPRNFFMMVEAGNIDHAAHANDGGTVIKETLNFQDAIRVAYEFYKKHPKETLIVVTTDHETGGMALANNHLSYAANLKTIDYQHISKDRFEEWCRDRLKSKEGMTWAQMRQYLQEKLGFWKEVKLSETQTANLHTKFARTFEKRNSMDRQTLYKTFGEFSDAVFQTANDISGVGFTSGGHSGVMVPVFAIGVGADRFNGLNDNTDIPKKILSLTQGK